MYYTTANKEYIPVHRPNLSASKTEPAIQPLEARVTNFDEVCLGYTLEQAMDEASRCLNCPGRYCAVHCPAHVPIPEFIALVRAGELEQAYQLIRQANCLPAITGRVCAQECQCEQHCTRGIKGEAVAIGRLETFVADWHQSHGLPAEPVKGSASGHVAVVGSGPAGLACAEALAKAGVSVDLLEKQEQLGGVPACGIPGFVLPQWVLQDKLAELRTFGVVFQPGQTVSDAKALLDAGYDAVFLGIGAGRARKTMLEGEALDGVWTAGDYLAAVRQKRDLPQADTVVVIGGGNTAIDAARSARRTGAKHVRVLYRRSLAEMPARREELCRAQEEGIELVLLTAPTRFVGEAGRVCAVECIQTKLTAPDVPNGRPSVQIVPGSERQIAAQLVILAVGYEVEPVDGVEMTDSGCVKVGADDVSTSVPGVYAAGDAVTGPATLVKAMAGGLRAAEAILRQLGHRP